MVLVSVLVSMLCAADDAGVAPPNGGASFEERFANPPAESRILKIVHMLPDAPEQQDALFDTLARQGFGGMATNVSFAGYVESEERWAAFVRAIPEAKRRGMCLWLYDERGYPSGNAGGITLRDHPKWEARGLLCAQTDCGGGPATLALPPGAVVRVAAFPVVDGQLVLTDAVDLSDKISGTQVVWDAPAGSWRVLAITEDRLYDGTHAAVSLADKLPYINMLMPEPTARFLEVNHQQYANRLGDDLGKYFVSTFTDEPSLMSLFMRPMPYAPLPWAPNLPEAFRARRGYAVEPLLPALFDDAGLESARVRYDFWLTVAELVSENFTGQIRTWCNAHRFLSGGHFLCEESLLTHVPLYGDFFRCARRLDAPSIDCLTSIPREVPWYIARLLSSVADLEGRTVTMCETSDHCQRYRPEGDTRPVYVVSEDEIRGTCNRLIQNGITTITSYYSFGGLSDEQMLRINEYVGRCCTALKGGHQVADIAVVYPAESLWPKFTPSRDWTKDASVEAQHVADTYRQVCDGLFRAGRDFAIVDARALENAEPRDGRLVLRDLEWRVVVLPAVDTLPARAWEHLEAFWRSGGVVVAVGALPHNSERALPDPALDALRDAMFPEGASAHFRPSEDGGAAMALLPGAECLAPAAVASVIEPDVAIPTGAPLHATHRRIDGREIYFVINDSAQPWEGTLSFAATGPGERWDPATGAKTDVAAPENVALSLGPYQGVVFRFAEAKPPARLPANEGSLVGKGTPLPNVTPTAAHGTSVEGDVQVDPQSAFATATARLTKSDVDTFMFLVYTYPDPVDLSGAEYLAFDLAIPERQPAKKSILAVLMDDAGMEYVLDTDVSLAASGRFACILPIDQFAIAGWKKQPDRSLDRARIRSLRIGWGGHFGKEGDSLVFSAGVSRHIPRAAR